MRIILDQDEIRAALAKAIEEKTQHIHGEVEPNDCWFEIQTTEGDVSSTLEDIHFGAEF